MLVACVKAPDLGMIPEQVSSLPGCPEADAWNLSSSHFVNPHLVTPSVHPTCSSYLLIPAALSTCSSYLLILPAHSSCPSYFLKIRFFSFSSYFSIHLLAFSRILTALLLAALLLAASLLDIVLRSH
jgi:hypothetical protein